MFIVLSIVILIGIIGAVAFLRQETELAEGEESSAQDFEIIEVTN